MTDTTETSPLAEAPDATPDTAPPTDTPAPDAPTPDTPLAYADFALPDGVEVDADTLDEARGLLAELKLPQEQAQRLVDFYAGRMRRFGEAQAGAWATLNEKWVADVKADREIGGDRMAETMAAATRAMDRFGTPGLREALMMTGAGNHPEIIRFVARVGRATAEDRFFAAAGASTDAARSAAQVLYPEQRGEE